MARIRTLTVGVTVAVMVVLAPAPPASAHDQLIASSPAAGERLDVGPENVFLEFSGQLLVMDDAGAMVIVVDEAGQDWVEGAPVVDGHTVTAALTGSMPEAGYEIRWRVVSSDGHPISGVIPFTIGDAEPLSTIPSDAGSAGAEAHAGTQDQTAIESPSSRVLRVALMGAGGGAVALASFAAILLIRRRGSHDGSGDLASDDARREHS